MNNNYPAILDELTFRWLKACKIGGINPLQDEGFGFTDWLRDNGIDSDSIRENFSEAPAKREFYVDTPFGQLKVWAKHETDTPEDFPGVYVDLAREGKADDLLACIEYDSCGDQLQTCVYQPGYDEPCDVVYHEMDDDENNDEESDFTVSMAVDGRIDVRVRATSFEEAFAKAESAFADADISEMEVVGAKPVNAESEDGRFTDYL